MFHPLGGVLDVGGALQKVEARRLQSSNQNEQLGIPDLNRGHRGSNKRREGGQREATATAT